MWSLHRRRRPVSPDLDAATVRAEMALFGLRKTRKEPRGELTKMGGAGSSLEL